ncbi:MAG: DJ-1/PfpI family protein [Candidatus Calescibacterium sp.]|nr:DJ-1/PfpI family protein [Candidatus Calescibacterium sp.]MDW8132318.1 DJ-1/PfpI family protein [Candidatus Calescibacterium sp.]
MKKPKVLTLISNGVEEMELVITVDILRRGGVDVDIVSLNEQIVECSRMVKIVADKVLDDQSFESLVNNYDALFIPGGSNNAHNLKNSPVIKKIIEHFMLNNKVVAAICAGPTVVNHHHRLIDYKATCYPTLSDEIPNFVDSSVVDDKNLLTSQGPATTFEFALKLLEKLRNKETKDSVSKATLFEKYFTKIT